VLLSFFLDFSSSFLVSHGPHRLLFCASYALVFFASFQPFAHSSGLARRLNFVVTASLHTDSTSTPLQPLVHQPAAADVSDRAIIPTSKNNRSCRLVVLEQRGLLTLSSALATERP
jgi:hypothetical protein